MTVKRSMVSSILSPDQKVLETRSTSPSTSSKSCGSSSSTSSTSTVKAPENETEGQEEIKSIMAIQTEEEVPQEYNGSTSPVQVHESKKDDRSRHDHVKNNLKREEGTQESIDKKSASKKELPFKDTAHQSHLANDSQGNDFYHYSLCSEISTQGMLFI